MGTNYYLHEETDRCPECGQDTTTTLHIGKSSAGWVFALRVHPGLGISDLADWIPRFDDPKTEIVDEYGKTIGAAQMMDIICNRRREHPPESLAWYDANTAEPGPNNLARAKLRPDSVVGHGAGTWDLHVGEFS